MVRPVSTEALFDFTPEPWVEDAACKGISNSSKQLFFAGQLQQQAANLFCSRCPVTWKCFSYAVRLNMGEGLWGGIPQWDRRQMLRKYHGKLDKFMQIDHARRVTELKVRAAAKKARAS